MCFVWCLTLYKKSVPFFILRNYVYTRYFTLSVKNNNKIKCDIYPEDSKIAGWLIVDTNSERTEYELPSGYEWCKGHITHARKALIQMNASQKLPKEKLIMWV